MTSIEEFRATYTEGVVMAPPGGSSEAASEGEQSAAIDDGDDPYEAYFKSDGFGLGAHRGTGGREWDRDDIDPKEPVLGIEHGGTCSASPCRLFAFTWQDDHGSDAFLEW